MAGPLSPAARLKSLSNDYGTTRGANAPDNWLAHIYDGNPSVDGVELDDASCPGYVAIEIPNDDFAATDDNQMEVTVSVPDAEGAWTKTGRFVVLEDADNLGEFWDYVPINALQATAAGPWGEDLEITINYVDDATEPS
jgi:hypothetical protein